MIPLEKIKEISAARGSKNAIITDDKNVTWSELHAIVSTITSNLTRKFDPNSDLAMCYLTPNRLELIYLMSAAATLKIPCTGIDYTQDACKLEAMLQATNCKILVTSSSYCVENNINLLELSRHSTIIDIDNTLKNSILYEDLIAETEESVNSILLQPKSFKSISFTSGTSGVPKSVIRNKSFDGRRFSFFTTRYGFSSKDRHLLAMPLYHAAGSGWSRLFMQLGATKSHDTAHMAELLKSEWISTSAMTPPLLNEVVRHYSDFGVSPNSNNLSFIIVGGKHFHPQAKLQAINTLGPVIHEYYGTTETGVNVLAEPKDLISNPTSVGKAYDGNNILVLDKDGNVLPPNEVGRIAISSYMNMDGYGNQETEFIELDGERYLITAETGEIDPEGNLYLRNRTQGQSNLNVYELENEIKHLPGIKDLAMLPVGKNKVFCGYVTNDDFFVDDLELIRNIKYICKR
ncbi:AMP-binding protein [Photobacterium indicum]|uniref:AMP-binding protein n=1 Tax=Photobacterium indicum TaxID=81447 RepID=UPI003D0BF2FC